MSAGSPVLQPNGNAVADPAVGTDASPQKPDKKASKKKGKQAGLVLGKGTSHLLSALAAAATGVAGESAEAVSVGPEDTALWHIVESQEAGTLSSALQVMSSP